ALCASGTCPRIRKDLPRARGPSRRKEPRAAPSTLQPPKTESRRAGLAVSQHSFSLASLDSVARLSSNATPFRVPASLAPLSQRTRLLGSRNVRKLPPDARPSA